MAVKKTETLELTFESKFKRTPDPKLRETNRETDANDRFKLQFSRLATDGPSKDLVVLVNGLAEPDSTLYDSDGGLKAGFVDRDFAVTQLPLPFHYNRLYRDSSRYKRIAERVSRAKISEAYSKLSNLVDAEKLKRGLAAGSLDPVEPSWGSVPAFLLAVQPERLYVAFRQMISDIAKLAKEIRRIRPYDVTDYRFDGWFTPETRIHLLGFSLGGLVSLASFIKQRTLARRSRLPDFYPKECEHGERDPHFETCTLLSSGSSFIHLVPDSLGVSPEQWNSLRRYFFTREYLRLLNENASLSEAQKGRLESINVTSKSYAVFEEIFLGIWDSEGLREDANRFCAVLGMSDPVVRPETLLGVRPRDRRFVSLHLPSLPHEIVTSEAWKAWGPFTLDFVANFMRKHPDDEMHVDWGMEPGPGPSGSIEMTPSRSLL